MKVVLSIFCCLLFGFNALAQAENQNAATVIETVSLWRDDGKGKAGETTDVFLATDTPIHCFIQLSSTKPAIVKLILVAVKAAGMPPETKSVSVSYTTNGNQNQVNFNASPEGVWAIGSYRADVYINGKLAVSRLFEVEKSAKNADPKKPSATKSVASRKSIKKPRKN